MLHKGNGLPPSDEDDNNYDELLDGDFFASQSEKDERLVTWKSNSPGVIRRILENRPKVPRTDNIPEIVKTLTKNIKPRSPTPPRIPERLAHPDTVTKQKSPQHSNRRRQRCRKPSQKKILESVAKHLEKRMRDEGMLGDSSKLGNASKNSPKASLAGIREEEEEAGQTSSQPFENSKLAENSYDPSWSDDDFYKSQAFIEMASHVEATALGKEPKQVTLPKRLFQTAVLPDSATGDSSPESSSPPPSMPWECPQLATETGGSQMPAQGTSFSLSEDSEIIPPTYVEVACQPQTPSVRRSERLRNISPGFLPNGRTVAKSPSATPAKIMRPVTPTTNHALGPFGSPHITADILEMFAEEDEDLNLVASTYTSFVGSSSRAPAPSRDSSTRVSTDMAKGSFKQPSPSSRYNLRKCTDTVSSTTISSLRTYNGATVTSASTNSAPGPSCSTSGIGANASSSVSKPSSIQEKRQVFRPHVQSMSRKNFGPSTPETPKSTRLRQISLCSIDAARRHLIADRCPGGRAPSPCKMARKGGSESAVQGTKEPVPAGRRSSPTLAAATADGQISGGPMKRSSAEKAWSLGQKLAAPVAASFRASTSTLRSADEEAFLMDDAMYGPDFLAAVEAIEAAVARSSSSKPAETMKPSYCSQEEIERKKQEALKRRERSRLRLEKR